MRKEIVIGALLGAALTFALIGMGAAAFGEGPIVTPGAGRFQAILLHPSTGTEWSGILDTQTGCLWVYASDSAPSGAPATAYDVFRSVRGANFMASVNYDPLDYTSGFTTSSDGKLAPDYRRAEIAAGNEAKACATDRRHAIGLDTK